jgi:peptidoglycan/xylan/chitin deacetylase (PgdA/CDA1 family)
MPKRKKIQIASLIIAGIIILIILSHLLIFLGLNIVLAVGMSFLLTSLTALWLTFIFHAGFDPWPDVYLNKKQKLVALTFDDGPSDSFTNKILNILKEKNVPASFFMLGKKLSNNLELAKELIKNNCEIGAHTYGHKKLHKSSFKDIDAEIQKSIAIVEALYKEAGLYQKYIKIFRAPHGFKSIRLKIYTKKHKIKLIPWTRGVWDTDSPGSEWIFTHATKDPRKNEIILLHDGLGLKDETDQEQISGLITALPRIIDFYKNKGYSFVKVSELVV